MSVIDLPLVPPQERAMKLIVPELTPDNAVVVTGPTGCGKSRLIFECLRLGLNQSLWTQRCGLFDQLSDNLTECGIEHGYRAAGHVPRLALPIQLSMIQTEFSKRNEWPLHDAVAVHVDEGHTEKGERGLTLYEAYRKRGSCMAFWTATPLGMEGMAKKIIVIGTNSEFRQCGMLVPAYHFGCDEPDLSKIKRKATGEFSVGEIKRAIMSHTIIGRVIEHYKTLNPEGRPTILFAPGVDESIWFCNQLEAAGIPSAHIDGDCIYMRGQQYKNDTESRAALKVLVESGEIKIVCNRYVMREGHDWPFISHVIFATVFGTLTGYIQAGGRGLRACKVGRWEGKTECTFQDHGGNWWRHGSLNSDRVWDLEHDDFTVCEAREERMRNKTEPEPICCPKCHAIRAVGPKCPHCGFQHERSTRLVVQTNGTLRAMTGDIMKPRRPYTAPNGPKIWEKCYYRAKNSKNEMTFAAAAALFARENNWAYPQKDWPLMPKSEYDYHRSVASVSRDKLHNYHEAPMGA